MATLPSALARHASYPSIAEAPFNWPAKRMNGVVPPTAGGGGLGDTGPPLRGRTADERGGPMSSSTETLLPRLLRSRVLPPKGGEQEHAVLVIGGDPFSPLRGE